ncbi:uncharacterized protein LOC116845018 [Odontomachus brunneus]|uniref:uncharacterized protein LOC116845018 n=1 Tax=Odontomachus brunneus TaxID=486640 RepID=UPI0013F20B7F|nr:uncharacterized protein LOC116845018 [Odontomachus brunneus]
MFRLMFVCVLACAVSVRCGTILAPAIGKLISEKVVESHGNSVVHASAPLVAVSPALRYTNVALVQQPYAELVQPVLPKASLVAEKTIEAHGHQVIHNAQPLHTVEQHVAIPVAATRELAYAAPIYYSAYPQLVAEKTVSSYGHSVQHVA